MIPVLQTLIYIKFDCIMSMIPGTRFTQKYISVVVADELEPSFPQTTTDQFDACTPVDSLITGESGPIAKVEQNLHRLMIYAYQTGI